MSVLEIPRVYFKGEIAWDPVTTNNYTQTQAPAGYDEDDCDSTLNATAVNSASVQGFRQAAINEIVSAGNWNPAGSYRCPFFNTCISGVDVGQGLDTGDPFVGAPVLFSGMLIDCEPYGATSSQLFFDDMSFGISGGCRVYGQRVTRYSDRYINFAANPNNNMIAGVASVVWQTCFDKTKGLQIDAHDSAVLAALQACVNDDDVLGVMVRFVTYRTVYYDDPTLFNRSPAGAAAGQALQAKLNAGGFQPNPARSLLVGTVGLWRKGDAPTEPSDRTLLTTEVPISVSTNPQIGPASCGTAWMRVGHDRLTLDMSNFVPWSSRAPEKANLGRSRSSLPTRRRPSRSWTSGRSPSTSTTRRPTRRPRASSTFRSVRTWPRCWPRWTSACSVATAPSTSRKRSCAQFRPIRTSMPTRATPCRRQCRSTTAAFRRERGSR
jgi:hypothetical protein